MDEETEKKTRGAQIDPGMSEKVSNYMNGLKEKKRIFTKLEKYKDEIHIEKYEFLLENLKFGDSKRRLKGELWSEYFNRISPPVFIIIREK